MAHSPQPTKRKSTKSNRIAILLPRRRPSHNNKPHLNMPCNFMQYKCPIPSLEGYTFCRKHILEDKDAPFRQCCYLYPHSRDRCPAPAKLRRSDTETYCPEHVYLIKKSQNRLGKNQPAQSPELLLGNIGHIVPQKNKSRVSTSKADPSKEKPLNPFVDCDAFAVNALQTRVLDYCSDSDSDVDVTTIGKTTFPKDEDSSDVDSIVSEDGLRHAGVFTSEEAVLYSRKKIRKLQKLYTGQFDWLKHEMRERRRDYLTSLVEEKESYSSIANQSRDSPKEQRLYQKLCSYFRYHKHRGVEGLLRKKRAEKEAATVNAAARNPVVKLSTFNKCVFTEGGVKCCAKTIPSTKFCLKHILEDPNQLLFRSCGVEQENSQCHEPVPVLLNMTHCYLHTTPPPMTIHYNSPSTSSDEEEEIKEENKETTAMEMFPVIKALLESPKRFKQDIKEDSGAAKEDEAKT